MNDRLVEDLARVIREARKTKLATLAWENLASDTKDDYRRVAKAAINFLAKVTQENEKPVERVQVGLQADGTYFIDRPVLIDPHLLLKKPLPEGAQKEMWLGVSSEGTRWFTHEDGALNWLHAQSQRQAEPRLYKIRVSQAERLKLSLRPADE